MTKGNEITGPLGGHDAGKTRDLQYVPLGETSVKNQRESLWLHADDTAGNRLPQSDFLGRNIHHSTGAGGVKMGQLWFQGSASAFAFRRYSDPSWHFDTRGIETPIKDVLYGISLSGSNRQSPPREGGSYFPSDRSRYRTNHASNVHRLRCQPQDTSLARYRRNRLGLTGTGWLFGQVACSLMLRRHV
jgi:hypothetical protein